MEQINIFPNPASDILNWENFENPNRIEIFDLTGKLLIKEKVLESNGSINISKLISNKYFVRITNQKGNSITKKFFVIK